MVRRRRARHVLAPRLSGRLEREAFDVGASRSRRFPKAAVEEGIVPGGGTALVNAITAVKKYSETLHGDQRIGCEIVMRALEEPLRQIANNAGEEGTVVVKTAKDEVKAGKVTRGFNAASREYEDLVKAGIIDPA